MADWAISHKHGIFEFLPHVKIYYFSTHSRSGIGFSEIRLVCTRIFPLSPKAKLPLAWTAWDACFQHQVRKSERPLFIILWAVTLLYELQASSMRILPPSRTWGRDVLLMMQSFRYDVCVQFNRKTKLAEELNQPLQVDEQEFDSCLLYTSDAADE